MEVSVANRLYEYRKQNNLSQDEVAEKIGVSRQAVSKWERAEASPDTDNLIALAKLYEVSLDDLINQDPMKQKSGKKEEDSFSISDKGLNFVDEDGTEVSFDRRGIVVKEKGSNEEFVVKPGEYKGRDEDGNIVFGKKSSFGFGFPISVIATVVYLILGAVFDLWHPGWIVFLIIPVFDELVKCLTKRTLRYLPVKTLSIIAYACIGFVTQIWHPTWLVLLAGPLYWALYNYFSPQEKNKNPKVKEEEKTTTNPE